jgi:hypothetical protein
MSIPARQRTRARLARGLIAIAKRLDPPRDPYGEWDPKSGQIIIKIPDGTGRGLPLANVAVTPGAITDRR